MDKTHTIYLYKQQMYEKVGEGKAKIAHNWIDMVYYIALYKLDDLPQETVFARPVEDFEYNFQVSEISDRMYKYLTNKL